MTSPSLSPSRIVSGILLLSLFAADSVQPHHLRVGVGMNDDIADGGTARGGNGGNVTGSGNANGGNVTGGRGGSIGEIGGTGLTAIDTGPTASPGIGAGAGIVFAHIVRLPGMF